MSNPPIPDAATPPLPHWEALARRWAQITPPLRPGPEDVAGYWRFAEAWIKRHGAPRVLLMGVTPELYQLPWPAGRTFLAVDRLKVMLDHIWPGRPDETLQADWAEMPLPPASYDLALCDAGMTLVDYPHGQRRVIDRKVSGGKTFVITDGGLHHHLAASGNFGQVLRRNFPVFLGNRANATSYERCHVVGCLCTPLDRLADDVELPESRIGDYVVIRQSGAYGRSASPEHFLGHPAPVEMLV